MYPRRAIGKVVYIDIAVDLRCSGARSILTWADALIAGSVARLPTNMIVCSPDMPRVTARVAISGMRAILFL